MSNAMPRHRSSLGAFACFFLTLLATCAAGAAPLEGVRRVVFLGDSITYAGGYIEFAEAYLRCREAEFRVDMLDLGLPSETVSGLSEPGHAGGKFPRPDLHQRLERVLAQTRPDLVMACYGMNCGMYHPFDEARFAKYQEGIRFVRERSAAHGARVLHVTPPVFDPEPIKARTLPAGLDEYRQPYVGYNDVLDRYSAWLVGQRSEGWDVVDVHTPMKSRLAARRAADPAFRLAADGVHLDATGHWLMARELLVHWGLPATLRDQPSAERALAEFPQGPEILKLVQQRQRLLKDAWLTATGHERPGMKPGLPLADAEQQAAAIEARLQALQKN